MGIFTKVLKNTAWFTVGVTAIAVKKAHDGINTIMEEVESGRPQELVRQQCTFIKEKVSSTTQRGKDASLHDKAMDELEKIKAKFNRSASCTN